MKRLTFVLSDIKSPLRIIYDLKRRSEWTTRQTVTSSTCSSLASALTHVSRSSAMSTFTRMKHFCVLMLSERRQCHGLCKTATKSPLASTNFINKWSGKFLECNNRCVLQTRRRLYLLSKNGSAIPIFSKKCYVTIIHRKNVAPLLYFINKLPHILYARALSSH